MTFQEFRTSLSTVIENDIEWAPEDPLSWEIDDTIAVWLEYSESTDAMILGARLNAPIEVPENQRVLNSTLIQANVHLDELCHFTSALTPDGAHCLLTQHPMEEITAEWALATLEHLASVATQLLKSIPSDEPTRQQQDPRFDQSEGIIFG